MMPVERRRLILRTAGLLCEKNVMTQECCSRRQRFPVQTEHTGFEVDIDDRRQGRADQECAKRNVTAQDAAQKTPDIRVKLSAGDQDQRGAPRRRFRLRPPRQAPWL
jgi:hypothetical protein